MSRGSSGSKSATGTIKTRIILVIGLILFLFTLVSGYCLYLAMSATGKNNAAADGPGNGMYAIAASIPAAVNSLQQHATAFTSRQEFESVPLYEAALGQLVEQARRLESTANMAGNAENAKVGIDIVKFAGEFDTSFQELVKAWEIKGTDENTGLRAELLRTSEIIERVIPVSASKKLADGLVQVNQAQAEYFDSHSPESLDQLEIAANTLEEFITRTTIDDPEIPVLQKHMKAYLAAFYRYQAVSLSTDDNSLMAAFAGEQQKQENAMRQAAQDLDSVISRLNGSALDAKADRIRQNEKQYLLDSQEKNVIAMNIGLDGYVQEVNSSSLPLEQKEHILEAVAGYREVFDRLVEEDKIISDLNVQALQSLTQLNAQVKLLPQMPVVSSDIISEITAFLSREDVLPAAGSVLAIVLIGLIAAMSLAKSVAAPIKQMTDIARKLAVETDPDLKFPSHRKNEYGLLASELNSLFLRQDISSDRISGPAIRDEDTAQERVSGLSTEQMAILDRIGNAAHKITGLSDALPLTVEKIMAQNKAINDLMDAGTLLTGATAHTLDLSAASPDQLTEIARTADDLAEEMNILALNAAIKAARAGSHGKEFIVVAEEMKSLATRAAESAANIAHTIDAITTDSGGDTLADTEADHDQSAILDMNTDNARAIDEIAVDTNIIIDQARGIEQFVRELYALTGYQPVTDSKIPGQETFADAPATGQEDEINNPEGADTRDDEDRDATAS